MQVRSLLLSTAAIFAAAAIESTPAYAEHCTREAGTKFVVCYSSEAAESVLVPELVTILSRKEAGTASKLSVPGFASWECANATNTGVFGAPGATGTEVLRLVISFSGNCKDRTEEAACSITEPITTKEISGLLSLVEGGPDITFKPTTGTEFAAMTFKSKAGHTCELAGTYKVTGSQLCTAPEIETDHVTQLFDCLPSIGLSFAEKEAQFELTEEVGLGSPFEGLPWSIIEGT
jgi:hypothetical protein